MKSTIIVLFILCFFSVIPAEEIARVVSEGAQNEYKLLWNDEAVGQHSSLKINPGILHKLTFQNQSQNDLVLHWIKTNPQEIAERMVVSCPALSSVEIPFGFFTAPSTFEYESGVVYRKGYQFTINILENDELLETYNWSQTVDKSGSRVLVEGSKERFVFSHGWGKVDLRTEAMLPALSMRLGRGVLFDQDSLEIICLSRIGKAVTTQLTVSLCDSIYFKHDFALTEEQTMKVDPKNWPAGKYHISLYPILEGKIRKEGPEISYNRIKSDSNQILLSPFAHWMLDRDTRRQIIAYSEDGRQFINDQTKVPCWNWESSCGLINTRTCRDTPLKIEPDLEGYYAVFADVVGESLLQIGNEGLISPIAKPSITNKLGTFVAATDLTGKTLNIFPSRDSTSRFKAIHLIPVNKESVQKFYQLVGNPQLPMIGINDWKVYFNAARRIAKDQIENIVARQKELGISEIGWSVGRSSVEYHSNLDNVTRWPAPPPTSDDPNRNFEISNRINDLLAGPLYSKDQMIQRYDCYNLALDYAKKHQVELAAKLGMNRHYHASPERDVRWSVNASRFYRENPQFHQMLKSGSSIEGNGRMSYFFEEVRQERLAILLEVASRGPNQILIGCCRQVPMLAYNAQMVETYQMQTGVDVRTIDASNDEEFTQWIKWRADFFTLLLRDLHQQLILIGNDKGEKIPVTVRVPSAGLYWNLAQGLDIERWMKEGLVDRIQLDPLDDFKDGSHDVRPYAALGRQYDVEIVGGIGSTWFLQGEWAVTPGLRRLQGLQKALLDGIEIAETEKMAICSQERWIIPYAGNPNLLKDFLDHSNYEACYPINAQTASYGHDNHSFREDFDLFGLGSMSL